MTRLRHAPPPPELSDANARSIDETELGSALFSRLDDRTVAYVLEMHACFDSLRQVAAQLAGLLVMAASGGRTTVLEVPVLDLAVRALGKAQDAVRFVAVPPAASHHHLHLGRAADRIGDALATARTGSLRHDDAVVETILKQLREGWQELHWAARALPGFQVVDFSQACCALHGTCLTNALGPAGFQVSNGRRI